MNAIFPRPASETNARLRELGLRASPVNSAGVAYKILKDSHS